MVGFIVAGIAVLLSLAVLTGHSLNQDALDAAWGRVATARRINNENARDLEQREIALDVRESELEIRERRTDYRERLLFEQTATADSKRKQLNDQSPPPDMIA